MSALVIIPARFSSSRFPGKPLEPLRGAKGDPKTLVQRTWEAAASASGVDRIVVATDDVRIRDEVHAFGGEAVMTSPDCRNGTERCAHALEKLGKWHEIIVNVQGDAPLTPPWFVEDLAAAMGRMPELKVATPVIRCDRAALAEFRKDRDNQKVGGTTAVFDARGKALYFSKEIVPWTQDQHSASDTTEIFHHVGIYAYTPAALRWYFEQPPGRLELIEGLEQLRFLEHGEDIQCVEVEAKGRSFWEVNIPEDIERVEERLAASGIE